MNGVKIFLDDIRQPEDCIGYMYHRIGKLNPLYLEKWIVVKNYDEFVREVERYGEEITHISLDHDLADSHYSGEMYKSAEEYYKAIEGSEKTGYDCAKWLKQYLDKKGFNPMIFCHSMNPVGMQNIINVFN